MRMVFLALLCAAMVLIGCGPTLTAREVCYGECDTRDASSAERSACRSSCSAARETVVGVEYVGSTSAPPWTCEAIAGRYLGPNEALAGKLEVFRAERSAADKSAAVGAATIAVASQIQDFATSQGVTYESLLPEPRVALTRNQQRKASGLYHRCRYRDHGYDEHGYVQVWPVATWPRPRVQLAGLPVQVPAALAWDPSKTPQTKIVDSGGKWTARGAVYFRVRIGDDLSPEREITDELTGIDGPDSNAESVLRSWLLERARAAADASHGMLVLDTKGGSLDPFSINSWQNTPKGVPVDWRGPTAWGNVKSSKK